MVDSIKTPLNRQHLQVNDNSGHDTFPRNNAGHMFVMLTIRKRMPARTILISFDDVVTFSNGNAYHYS